MKSTTIIGIVIALILGGVGGYVFGKGSGNPGEPDKKLQDSIAMMKEQSSNIRKMGEIMKSGGAAMQEMGMKYKDDAAVNLGKDLEVFGDKYLQADAKATKSDDSMKKVME
ncbi:MAG: hypothetical protein HY978_00535 [Candidatus Liptonbacteria bacterium]|nr:hypothetical protein [Candidatus Liptonbacteria bacterium]